MGGQEMLNEDALSWELQWSWSSALIALPFCCWVLECHR